jgi:adenylate cyclase
MLVYADPDKGNGAPVTTDSRFDGPLEGASMIRRLRLFSGLVMLAYVTMHLLNHAVGLVSLEAMENVLWYIFRIWTNRLAQLLLYGSFLVHYALALYALWQRRTLRLRASELSQVVLGFAIPFLLVRHVVTTRISDSFLHTDVGYYAYLLWVYFVRSPNMASCRC